MKLLEKRKKILAGFVLFLIAMWVCTLISRSVYAAGLPRVDTASLSEKSIEHKVEAQGIVEAGGERAVNVESGIRVENVLVHVGDVVDEDTVLFGLDVVDLRKLIGDKEIEVEKLKLAISAIQANGDIEAAERQTEIDRAQEDKKVDLGKSGTALSRADTAYAEAEERLGEHEANGVRVTSDEEREHQKERWRSWREEEARLAGEVEAARKRKAEAEKKLADAIAAEGEGNPPSSGEPGDQIAPNIPGEEGSQSQPADSAGAGEEGAQQPETGGPQGELPERQPGEQPGNAPSSGDHGVNQPQPGGDGAEGNPAQPSGTADAEGNSAQPSGTADAEGNSAQPAGTADTEGNRVQPDGAANAEGNSAQLKGTDVGEGNTVQPQGETIGEGNPAQSQRPAAAQENLAQPQKIAGGLSTSIVRMTFCAPQLLAAPASGAPRVIRTAAESSPAAPEPVSGASEPLPAPAGAVEEARKELQAAEEALKAAEDALANHEKNPVEEPDFSGEDSARKAWEAEKKGLEDSLRKAGYDREDAQTQKEDTVRRADRNIEDASVPEKADSTLAVKQLELAAMQEELEELREILKVEGKIRGGMKGTITRIGIRPGERTADGPALVYADMAMPLRFLFSLTKEQKKYVNQGDAAMLKLGEGEEINVCVDYLAQNTADSAVYDGALELPEGKGSLGQSGTFKLSWVSEKYGCCVPVEALHSDGERTYLFVVEEREGILGKELTVSKVYVKVIDKNDMFAALQEGSLSGEEEVVVYSDKELKGGETVRYR